jgi:dephospho-CoA kinase
MKIIGLTGGIASGKSTVARLLATQGVPVIDADQLSRVVVEPETVGQKAVAARWPQVVDPWGVIDRAALGAIVFADPAERAALTAIVIPLVVEEFRRRAQALEAAGEELCVFEAATLFEEQLEALVDGVLVVTAPPEEQVRRLMARTGLSQADARARLAAQLPLSEKVARSRWVLDNGGPEAELAPKVRALWDRLRQEAAP